MKKKEDLLLTWAIRIIFDSEEKKLISDMDPNQFSFCSFPEDYSIKKIHVFMNDIGDEK